jgi:hypothetical protein
MDVNLKLLFPLLLSKEALLLEGAIPHPILSPIPIVL